GAGTAPCGRTGRTTVGTKCQETFAWGLRNPFRFAFDPNAAGARFYINDVGQNHWEEIDEAKAGGDYGWNVREGHCAADSSADCGPPPAGMTNPIFDYAHFSGQGLPTDGCESITGGAFVPAGVWPSEYDADYLFGDFVCGKIFRLAPAAGGGWRATEFASGLGDNSVTTMTFGPDGGLYYTLAYYSPGEIRRIAYTGTANRSPTAAVKASPTSGSVPLTVTFDASGSSDPDGDVLTYLWKFGDGETRETTSATATHTYSREDTYFASLRVRDDEGAVSLPKTVRIDAGNAAPVPVIERPAADKLFRVGEEILLRGSASDPEDGSLPESRLTWTVLLHHGTHTHPFFGPSSGNDLSITAPAPEDLAAAATSYLEIRLRATDSKGLSSTVTQALRPNAVKLTFATKPAGLTLEINREPAKTPMTVTSWEGYELRVNAPAQGDGCAESWVFDRWSDAGAAEHTITTPSSSTSYTATFRSRILFRDGFESGGLTSWSGGAGLVVQGEEVYSGTHAARAKSNGTPAYAYKQLESPRKELYYFLRFNLEEQGANSVDLLRVRTSAGTALLSVFVNPAGTLKIRSQAGDATIGSSAEVTRGVWHDFELHVRSDGVTGETEVWLDDQPIGELSTTTLLGTDALGWIQLGDKNVGRVYNVLFDDIVLSDAFIRC
ncbi:MAG: PKD domain-containing protein, partial [Actinomycetota bacterium]|nr:PKD domain-containing protein [Actinomycetota bacterium]